MQKVKYVLFYLQEYGWLNFVKKIDEQLSRIYRPALNRIFNSSGPDMSDSTDSAMKIFTCPGLPARVNLVLEHANEANPNKSIAMIFGIIIAARLEYDLRIISSPEVKTGDFHHLLAASGLAYANNVEFIADDTALPNHEIEVADSDLFVTTSWQTTRKVIGSINENSVIYLMQQDERKLCESTEARAMCTDIFKNKEIRFIVASRSLYDQLLADGFVNIQQQGSWYDAHMDTTTPDDIRTIVTHFNDVIRHLAVFEKK